VTAVPLERWRAPLAEGSFSGVSASARPTPLPAHVGVWVDRTQPGGVEREDKIAAIGVRVRRWVSFHGIALNVEPELSHFQGITPCGIADPRYGVTSLVDLGLPATMQDADEALKQAFIEVFGPVRPADPPA